MSEISEIFGERRYLTEVQWEGQSNDGEWREYASTESRVIEVGVTVLCTHPLSPSSLQASHIAHEEEVGIAVLGRSYIVDLVAVRQVRLCGVLY